MANERTYPALPCADLDGSVAFYEALGFTRTYRQVRPNPYAVVAREDIHIHLFGIEGFDPAQSYGTAIVVVPDPDRLYRDFAAGLREVFGKLPVAGIPRITATAEEVRDGPRLQRRRPGRELAADLQARRDRGGGLRGEGRRTGADLFVAHAPGRCAWGRGAALKTLESGLTRFGESATAIDLARAHLYRAELAVRTMDPELARSSLAAARSIDLADDERAALADEFDHVTEVVEQG